jgi:beta-aspartyl-peptidase (threonine type)
MLWLLLVPALEAAAPPAPPAPPPFAIAIHGGAGVIERAKMTPEKEAGYRAGLAAALDAAYAILERGGTSLDAVTTAVRMLEDDPQFNAGRGAVLNQDGDAELDAAIMDGHGPHAGAVASVRHVKNPIDPAPGHGAQPARAAGRRGGRGVRARAGRSWCRAAGFRRARAHEPAGGAPGRATAPPPERPRHGAVARPRRQPAAATSTGASPNKHGGRNGDSLIGAAPTRTMTTARC